MGKVAKSLLTIYGIVLVTGIISGILIITHYKSGISLSSYFVMFLLFAVNTMNLIVTENQLRDAKDDIEKLESIIWRGSEKNVRPSE